MKILVCLKQVLDRNQNIHITPDKLHVQTEGKNFVENEFDRYAIEEALQLKEKHNGEVVLATIGPARALDALRKGLAMGADRAYHVQGEELTQLNAYPIAKILSKIAEKENFDLILTGLQSEDQSYAMTGPMLAELLQIPYTTTVVNVEYNPPTLHVQRELEGGDIQELTLPTPALLTIQTGINTPRYPTLPNIMKAKRKPVQKPTLEELSLNLEELQKLNMTQTLQLNYPPKNKSGTILQGSSDEIVEQLVKILKEEVKAF